MTDFCHKLRNLGQVFAPNRETKKPSNEIALKQGRVNAGQSQVGGGSCSGPQEKLGVCTGEGTMFVRHWLDYDFVALAVLVIGLGAVELLALSI